MKIVHMTSVHPIHDSRIFYKECQTLHAHQFNVTLIAPANHDTEINGINICAIKSYRSRLKRALLAPFQIYLKALHANADLYHFHDPELIPIAILLKFHRKKIVYDVHEDYPTNILHRQYLPQVLRKCFSVFMIFLEKLAARFCTAIITVTPKIAQRFPSNKTFLVRNYCDLNELSWPSMPAYEERPHDCLYVGSLSAERDLAAVIDAVSLVPSDYQVKLQLAGKFHSPYLLQNLQQSPNWNNVNYLGYLDRQQVKQQLTSARMGLLILPPVAHYKDSYPIKLFEYMAAGLPVIASDFPVWRNIIEHAKCGLLVDPLNKHAIAAAIQYLIAHPKAAKQMGDNGRKAVVQNYNWSNEAATLVYNYKKILNI